MKHYCGYIRVSTPRQGERGVSLQEQRDAISRYAAKFNLTITEWFEEQQTAAKSGRPVWNRMLRLLRHGEADGVIIHKIDRSARNLKDWSDLGETIDDGIEVHFANEALDLHSRGGRLSADIQAVVAADYIRNLREETKKGIYGRLKQGIYPLQAPLGYRDNGGGKLKTIDPIKGPLVKKAFEMYANGTSTILSLVDELYRMGLRNHAGGRVTRTGLSTILNNPFYMGVIRVRRTKETYQGKHEALISKRLFEAVQAVRDRRLNAREKRHRFLFRRLIRCNECGYALIGELQKGHVYYRCQTRVCPTKTVREDRVSDFVEHSLAQLSFTGAEIDYLRMATERLKQDWVAEKDRQVTMGNMKLQQLSDRLGRLTDAYLDQTIDKELFEERKKVLLFERRSVEEQLESVKHDSGKAPVTLQKFLELVQSTPLLYKLAIPEQKRMLVEIVTSNLTVGQKSLDFPYVSPFREVAVRNRVYDSALPQALARTCDDLISVLTHQIEACAAVTAALVPDTKMEL